MRSRVSIQLALVVLAVMSAAHLYAKDTETTSTHEGMFVSLVNDKLTMNGTDGKEHSHSVTKTAKYSIDGKDAKPAEFKSGMKIRVTTTGGTDTAMVTMVEGLDKNPSFGK